MLTETASIQSAGARQKLWRPPGDGDGDCGDGDGERGGGGDVAADVVEERLA